MSGASPGWPSRLGRAGRFAADPGAATIALAGFLVRGGLVPLLLPIVVVPSVIDVAGVVGVDAFSIAGQPTPLLIAAIVVIVLAATAWLIVAALFGSVVDAWLVQLSKGRAAADEPAAGDDMAPIRLGALETPDSSLVMELAAMRVLWLVPLGLAIAWATTQLFGASYGELITPSNVSTPLPVRVVLAATPAVAVVFVAWLVTETVSAIAVRRHLLSGADFTDSITGALGEVVRRPLQTIGTAIVPLAVSLVTIGLVLLASGVAFDWCRVIARSDMAVDLLGANRDVRPLLFALAALALVLMWLAALAVAAVSSAWRSAAFTLEVEAALKAEGAGTGRE